MTPLRTHRIALAASVAAHALVAGLWLDPSPHHRSAEVASRSRPAMTVRLYSVPAPAIASPARTETALAPAKPLLATPPRTRVTAAPTTRAQPLPLPLPLPKPQPQPQPQPIAAKESQPDLPPLPSPPDNAPPAVVPGAAFAGLFAPIISRPIGNGGWGRRSNASPPALDPHVQREQALQELRMSLLDRLNDLAGRMVSSGQDLRCDIAVDGPRRLAEVRCTDSADQGAPWSALQGLLAAGTVPAEGASLCLRLAGSQVTQGTCAEAPIPAAP